MRIMPQVLHVNQERRKRGLSSISSPPLKLSTTPPHFPVHSYASLKDKLQISRITNIFLWFVDNLLIVQQTFWTFSKTCFQTLKHFDNVFAAGGHNIVEVFESLTSFWTTDTSLFSGHLETFDALSHLMLS